MAHYVIANWKMNGGIRKNIEFFQALQGMLHSSVKAAICAPFPYMPQLSQLCAALPVGLPIEWGAQDVSEHFEGAYTGEVSVAMLEDFGCSYVIIGHSERRQYHAESSGVVARKLDRVMQSVNVNLIPVICIGEHLSEREAGDVESILAEQLDPVLAVLKLHSHRRAIFAYEPVWAIGTGVVATPEEVSQTHEWIAKYIYAAVARELPILYGGSVKPDNAESLIALPHVQGFLVGGASLKAETFMPLLSAAAVSHVAHN
jgi:triosephosphate isomerase (TIM)